MTILSSFRILHDDSFGKCQRFVFCFPIYYGIVCIASSQRIFEIFEIFVVIFFIHLLLPRLDGWISYGFVDTKRKWLDYEEYAPSSYDVTHNLTLIAMYRITDAFRTGVNFKYATGRPFTPVNGSVYREQYDVYEPVYGIKNSERYDNFRRLDLRFMYFRQLFGRYFTVFFFEAINVLNINNLFGYTFSRDYSEREEIQSYFGRRTVVFGVAVNL